MIEYQETSICLDKSILLECRECLISAIENANQLRQEHEQSLGRATRKNQYIGELYDADISRAEKTLTAINARLGIK